MGKGRRESSALDYECARFMLEFHEFCTPDNDNVSRKEQYEIKIIILVHTGMGSFVNFLDFSML